MNLVLTLEEDLFLLFVLAIAWSRSGPWENAAYFVTYLKNEGFDKITEWSDEKFVTDLKEESFSAAMKIQEICYGIDPRKKISFRRDIYDSVSILAKSWEDVKKSLEKSKISNDYTIFIKNMRGISGLGTKGKKMNIKILLILRELRCQKIYDNIPGELCCVPDERVKKACYELGIKIPANLSSIEQLLVASKQLYLYFGDMYDIPAFAYNDLKDQMGL